MCPCRISIFDFCFERRQEVIDYVVRKYGKDRVVQIVTFGTMAARGVIRDVGRVMDLPYAFVDTIAKMIPTELNITIDKALKMNPEFRKMYETDEQVKYLIDMSKRLEGSRHTSMHAAGVVISQKVGRRICAAFQSIGRFDHDTVYDDDTGRTWSFENGFPGLENSDRNSECRQPGGAGDRSQVGYG